MNEIKIKNISKLNLKPGDYIVVKTKEYLSDQVHKRLKEALETVFREDIESKNIRILVLDGGLELEKVRVS